MYKCACVCVSVCMYISILCCATEFGTAVHQAKKGLFLMVAQICEISSPVSPKRKNVLHATYIKFSYKIK